MQVFRTYITASIIAKIYSVHCNIFFAINIDKLPTDLQKKVQDFVQALVISLPKGKPGKSYLEFAGTLDNQSTDEISKAIEEGCEKVDFNEW